MLCVRSCYQLFPVSPFPLVAVLDVVSPFPLVAVLDVVISFLFLLLFMYVKFLIVFIY